MADRITEHRIDLIARYGKEVDPEILKGYLPADEYIIYHEHDTVLKPIKINLPAQPEAHFIDGFGLPAKEQKFTTVKIPKALEELPKKVLLKTGKDSISAVWEYLYKNQKNYSKEIAFIRKMWYHRIYGYWCYINGKATYMDGWHWLYCNFWFLDIGLPQYRSRDRKFFIFARFAHETTESVYNYMVEYVEGSVSKRKFFATGKQARNFARQIAAVIGYDPEIHEGIFVVDMKRRTVVGFIYPKHRREGATYRAALINFEIISRARKALGGMQSMDEDTGSATFEKNLVLPWKDLWWVWKPEYRGSNTHAKEIDLSSSTGMVGKAGASLSDSNGIQSVLNYATTAHEKFYDGKKMLFYHDDEVAKLEAHDCYLRNQKTLPCLAQGNNAIIHGYTIKTSTVGEFSKGGGANFKRLCDGSNFYMRNSNGQTETGLIVLFIPAYDGLDGFIDEYGESVVETPTPEQAKFIGRDIGAREFLRNQIEDLESKQDDPKMRVALLEQYRLFPTDYKHLFMKAGEDSGFNIVKLSKRISELTFDDSMYVVGDLTRDKATNKVSFTKNPDGMFKMSKNLSPEEANQFFYDHAGQTFRPRNPKKRIASSDAYRYEVTKGKRMSDGAGAVFERRDPGIDGDHKPFELWQTHRFICTYLNRPTSKRDYNEHMLCMCLYFGCLMSPEINVEEVWDYFRNEGFEGMLYFFWDPVKKQYSPTPGFNSLTRSKQKIFDAWQHYIEFHTEKENHREVLQECLDIPGIEAMTDYDLFTAGGGCLITDENMNLAPGGIYSSQKNKPGDDSIDLFDYYQLR